MESNSELIWNAEQQPSRELFYDKEFKKVVSENREAFAILTKAIKKFLNDNSFYELNDWDVVRDKDGKLNRRNYDFSAFEDLEGTSISVIHTSPYNSTFKIKIPGVDTFVVKVLKDEFREEGKSADLVNNEPIHQAISTLLVEKLVKGFNREITLPSILVAFKDANGGFLISQHEDFDNGHWFDDENLRNVVTETILHVVRQLGYRKKIEDVPTDNIEEYEIWLNEVLQAYMPDSAEIYRKHDGSGYVWLDFVLRSVQDYLSTPNITMEEVRQKYL